MTFQIFTILCICLLVAAACQAPSNVQRINQVHQPAKMTDTHDKPIEQQERREVRFDEAGVVFSNEFDTGRMADVTQVGSAHFQVLSKPENHPINDSPWYAFKVSSLTGPQTVTLTLAYENGHHRYVPKLSRDAHTWTVIDSSAYQVNKETNTADLKLDLTEQPIWVAAQEIMSSQHMYDWVDQLAQRPFINRSMVGKSNLGKEIPRLTIGADDGKVVLVLGRLHPPEVTGSMALMRFIETICDESELSQRYRTAFKTVVTPLVNPDGVDEGHWRHNMGGIDLNRDWAEFNQLEPRLVSQNLLSLKDEDVVFGIDFHSTFYDIFYVLDDSVGVAHTDFIQSWIDEIATRLPDYKYRLQPVNAQVPASMAWMYRTFGIPVVTYEVGDRTPRDELNVVAETAARALMEQLLATVSTAAQDD